MSKTLLATVVTGSILSVAMFSNTAGALTFAAQSPVSGAQDAALIQKAALCCDWFGYFACWRFPDHYRHYRSSRYGWRCW
jgi:hypothetical protein